ncbi:hypothetical protein [Serratia fonticola]|uniref:hypothetical protein n=1 Tax=Serratia fonticola TaxID=47917 RepID=UPI00192CF945|nr:hypothetical protein [Serratia fonticola]MBL5825944.1 hypothetical protein [Serratia fonticola]
MMRNHKLFIIGFIAILLLLAMATLFYLIGYKSDKFTCEGEAILHTSSEPIVVNAKYIFNGTEGEANIEGKAMKKGAPTFKIVTYFSFERNSNNYSLTSKGGYTDNILPAIPASIAPDFFFIKGRGLHFVLERYGKNGYIIINGDLPGFICYSTDS